jgi:hypothetical protein
MGGGLVIDATRELDEMKGFGAVNGLYDGSGFLQHARRRRPYRSFAVVFVLSSSDEPQTGTGS